MYTISTRRAWSQLLRVSELDNSGAQSPFIKLQSEPFADSMGLGIVSYVETRGEKGFMSLEFVCFPVLLPNKVPQRCGNSVLTQRRQIKRPVLSKGHLGRTKKVFSQDHVEK